MSPRAPSTIVRGVADVDFFISYTGADQRWAEWIAWQLEAAGYKVIIQAWDFGAGGNFIVKMHEALASEARVLAVLSRKFLESVYATAEWSAAFAEDPIGAKGHLVFVRIEDFKPGGLLAAAIYIDLVGLEENAARERLLKRLETGRAKPATAPGFPGARGVAPEKPRPVFPPAAPAPVHNLPFRPNRHFAPRDTEMEALRKALATRGSVAVTQAVAVHGLGGVGKTQLAIEYAHAAIAGRAYDAILWVRADSAADLETSLAALAPVLGLGDATTLPPAEQAPAVLKWLATHERWLLLADNVDDLDARDALRSRLPISLPGHLLITSRLDDWPGDIPSVALDTFSPPDATRFLTERAPNAGPDADALTLATALGYLPLALEQAAAFIVELRGTFREYVTDFENNRAALLAEHHIDSARYPSSVAATWRTTIDRLGALPRTLLRLAAFFAPEPIPRFVFTSDPEVIAEALGAGAPPPSDLELKKALSELARFSLLRLETDTASLHRLVQMVEQDAIPAEEHPRWINWAIRLINAATPGFPDDVRTWPLWEPLRSHCEALLECAQRRGVTTQTVGVLCDGFAQFLAGRAEYNAAEPLYRRALEIGETTLGKDHRDVATWLNNLANLLRETGRREEAEPLYRRALAIGEATLGKDHPDVATRLNNLANLLRDTGRREEAEPLYRRALTIGEAKLGKDHPDVATWLNNLAKLLQDNGSPEEAEPLFRRALAISEASLGKDHPGVADRLNNLAELLRETGRLEEAEPFSRRALAIVEKALPAAHPYIRGVRENLDILLADLRRKRGE